MYTITSDHTHYIHLSDKEEAIRLADLIRGGVYVCSNGEMVLIHSYND
jgi:hypothetical protein